MRRSFLLLVAAALLAGLTGAVPAAGMVSPDDGGPAATEVSTDYAIVTFKSPPAASYTGGIDGLERTKPVRGRLDPDSPAYRAYVRFLENEHADFRAYVAQRLPGAEIVSEYYTVLNGVAVKLNGAELSRLQNGPKVKDVGHSALYRPTMNISTDLVRASEVWGGLGGEADAGSGIKVAIIDTGIDLTNPFFDDNGYDSTAQIDKCPDQDLDETTPNTNNKVIVCRVYASGSAGENANPALFFDHGTHVAGTVAGNSDTSGTVAGTNVEIDGLGGMAPGALLGNYNVFPGFGAGFVAFGGSAFSHDIAAALEDAVLDGMHVANMSLGGTVQGPHDFLAEASNAAVDAGMVLAVAAGNSGPGDATVESPGSAEKVITAGASSNPHFVGIPASFSPTGGDGATVGAALGDFNNFDPALTADYTVTEPANGCAAISTDLAGQIALIDRGACSFTTKIRNAEDSGAVGVLVVNNVAGDPTAMAHDGTDPFPEIPAAMVGNAEGEAVKPDGEVTVDGTTPQEFVTDNADIIAGFSSRGPTPFTSLIKPDVTAPGVNVLSSVFDGEFAFFQGTSMATPHVAGAAALILDGFPDASPAEVKSRLANSAARVVTDHVNGTDDPGVLTRGGGRIDMVEGFDAATFFDPVSVSFGENIGNRPLFRSVTVDVSGTAISGVAVEGDTSADLEVTATVNADGDLVVSLSASRTLADGDYEGDVVVTAADGQTYLVPWWVRIVQR